MSLAPGSRLGVYDITAPLGEGGMGQVWRAVDSTLGRQVAIKILPDEFAKDPDRLARFEREAKTLASLNHPHIAAVYGFEKSAGRHALIMELVAGEDLSQRLARGPLPLHEALAIARQLAAGLEQAHERGIVHRDLKPANIKVAEDGTVKILDFGLAKLWAKDKEMAGSYSDPLLAPTLTMVKLTSAGIILGTASYMSPEQARGRPVDQRADIWALGVILTEMLTGTQVFAGETVSDILARVLEREPDWSTLPAHTPANVRRMLRRCLEKDPARRLRHVADARLELEDESEHLHASVAPAHVGWRRWAPWGLAGVAGVLTMAALATRPGESITATTPTHFEISDPPGVRTRQLSQRPFALSADGRRLAFIGVRAGVRQVFVRSVEKPDLVEIPDSSGAIGMTFSPDGSALGFIGSNGGVGVFQFGDGSVRALPAIGDINGATAWGTPGLVFQRQGELWIVDPAGGAARQLTSLDATRGEIQHVLPAWLDDRVLVFTALTNTAGAERIEAVTLDGQPRRTVVMERARRALWSPTGHLVFDRDGALQAVPFDLETLKPRGAAAVVLPPGTASDLGSGGLSVELSRDGTLAYGSVGYGNSQIVIVSRDGSSRPLDVPPARFTNPRVSPDGTRLALDDNLFAQAIVDLARGTRTTPIQPALGSGFVAWNSDGSRLAFRRFSQPYSMSADGKQDGGAVPHSTSTDYLTGAGPDPDHMLAVRLTSDLGAEIYLFSLSGAHPPRVLISGPGYQGGAQLSPDGRWLLYQSDETGQPEIFVRAYPALDRGWQVSVGGGLQARWGVAGREVLYRSDGAIVSVAFDGRGAVPGLGKPQVLFDQPFDYGQGVSIANYDVLPDGRFVMLRSEPGGAPFHVIRNWASTLAGR